MGLRVLQISLSMTFELTMGLLLKNNVNWSSLMPSLPPPSLPDFHRLQIFSDSSCLLFTGNAFDCFNLVLFYVTRYFLNTKCSRLRKIVQKYKLFHCQVREANIITQKLLNIHYFWFFEHFRISNAMRPFNSFFSLNYGNK